MGHRPGWTLRVLRKYASDTETIATASVTQTERAQMPFLAVTSKPYLPGQVTGWCIENQGFGPAVNIKCTYEHHGSVVKSVLPLAVQGVESFPNFSEVVGNPLGFEIQYESLSGRKYRTLITWDEEGKMRTRFEGPLPIAG